MLYLNCFNKSKNNLSNQFLQSNIIDNEYNIRIGIYIDKEKKKSTILTSQGIIIENFIINKIILAMKYNFETPTVVLYFENNICVLIIKESKDKIKFVLKSDKIKINKYIDNNIINNLKPINNNSEFIDMIIDIVK